MGNAHRPKKQKRGSVCFKVANGPVLPKWNNRKESGAARIATLQGISGPTPRKKRKKTPPPPKKTFNKVLARFAGTPPEAGWTGNRKKQGTPENCGGRGRAVSSQQSRPTCRPTVHECEARNFSRRPRLRLRADAQFQSFPASGKVGVARRREKPPDGI